MVKKIVATGPSSNSLPDGQYRVLTEAITDYAIYMLDPDGLVMTWNSGAERSKGYQVSEIIGKNFSVFFDAADQAAGEPRRALDTAAREKRFDGEAWRVRKDGSRFLASVVINPIRDAEGTLIGFAVVTLDIEELKNAQRSLDQANVVPTHLLDGKGIITGVSKSWLSLLGYSETEVLGHAILEFQTAGSDALAEAQGVRLEAEGAARDVERQFRRRDGSIMDALVSERLEGEGQNKWISCVLIDITARRQAEEALHLTEERLRQAQKMETIGRLAAGAAHDFNNTLQSIIGALELVLDDAKIDRASLDFLNIARNAAVRGASLTNHLLSYARQQMLKPDPIELAPFLSDVRKLLIHTLGPHIVINVRVAGQPFMLADPGQLQTALLNLAINAAHAMDKGGEITMRAREITEAGETWGVIVVSDTGVGMDATTLARAVEPFFTTKGVDGSGLGLSMVQGFAEQSGGGLAISSIVGQGTTVELRLPAGNDIAKSDNTKQIAVRPASPRILLVDDSQDVLLTMAAFLFNSGFEVVSVENATEAVAFLGTRGPFDLLITDQAMPGMTGSDLIVDARTIQPGLPALIITGFANFNLADDNMKATQVLHKPVQRAALLDAVSRILKRDSLDMKNIFASQNKTPGKQAIAKKGNSHGDRT